MCAPATMKNIPAPSIRPERRALGLAVLLLAASPLAAQWKWLNLGSNPALLPGQGDHLLCCGVRGATNPDAVGPNHLFAALNVAAAGESTGGGGLAPMPVSAGAAAESAGEEKKIDGGFLLVGFDKLSSFNFNPPGYDASGNPQPSEGDKQIPERIKKLNEQPVAVTGFMLPVKMDGGLVKEFLLVRDPMLCCYGMMPKINEWVVVKMNGAGVKPLMDVPITFAGKLKVGEMFENGYLTGIYLLEGEKQVEVKG
jgi:hypothetical protein